MEGIWLQHFIHQKVGSLRDALNQYRNGNALVYTFQKPNSLFVGTIPRDCAVIWRYPKHEELYIASSGCTFFTWNHIREVFVVTGVVIHKFELSETDVFVKFHVFDPVKLCSSIEVDKLHDQMESALRRLMKGHEDDAFESVEFKVFKSQMYFELNRTFQGYGVSIDGIRLEVRLNLS